MRADSLAAVRLWQTNPARDIGFRGTSPAQSCRRSSSNQPAPRPTSAAGPPIDPSHRVRDGATVRTRRPHRPGRLARRHPDSSWVHKPLHPGARTSLFPSLDLTIGIWGQYTDRTASSVDADVYLRAHAHVEDHIRRLKSSGLERFPFTDLDANHAWMALVCFAADLVRWVPAAVPARPAHQRRTQDTALAALAHPCPRRATRTTDHRADPRRLARRRRGTCRLPPHRAHRLTRPDPTLTGPTAHHRLTAHARSARARSPTTPPDHPTAALTCRQAGPRRPVTPKSKRRTPRHAPTRMIGARPLEHDDERSPRPRQAAARKAGAQPGLRRRSAARSAGAQSRHPEIDAPPWG